MKSQAPPSHPLNILCIGAGAIGTYLGGSLMLAGNRVVFLEKAQTALQIQQMRLQLADGKHILKSPEFTSNVPDALSKGPFDLAIFALKSFDTASAMKPFANVKDNLPPFLSLQNGVENEDKIATIIGTENVIPATVTTAVGKHGPGDITLEKFRGIGISALHPLSMRLETAFKAANLNPQLFSNPAAMKWSKMLTNLVANATSAVLGLPPGDVYTQKSVFQVEAAQLRETLQVMSALNLPVVDLPGTPVRLLAAVIKFLPLSISRPLLKKAVIGGRGDKMPSFYLDLYSGRDKSEVEFLNGAVVRAGKRIGVPTPANAFLTTTLLRMVQGDFPKETYQNRPEKFRKDYENFTE
ncbi:MAG: 2-dehydropantoate 2-reductase [Anaerolineales bacterium]